MAELVFQHLQRMLVVRFHVESFAKYCHLAGDP